MYGIPTFDSESFELELKNGSAWDTSGSRFVGGGGGWGKNGQRWSQTAKLSLFESQRALSVLAFLCEIRVLYWAVLVYGIPVFDSESFELELNGSAWDTTGSRFVQIPSVVLEIRFRPMSTKHHERTTLIN